MWKNVRKKQRVKEFSLLPTSLLLFVFVFPRKKAGMALATLARLERNRKENKMKKRKSVVGAIILSGAVGLVSAPAWSQEAPGETRQPDPNLTRPGRDQNVPGVNQRGTPELSKNDMRAVEEALQAKGYKPGKIDGVADDDARKAIRDFQKDNGIPITGTVDQRTADKLGIKISAKSGGMSEGRSSSGGTSGQSGSRPDPNMKKSGDDQSLPPAGTRNY
jgi:hypothetical protein